MFPLTFARARSSRSASMPGWLQSFTKVNPITI